MFSDTAMTTRSIERSRNGVRRRRVKEKEGTKTWQIWFALKAKDPCLCPGSSSSVCTELKMTTLREVIERTTKRNHRYKVLPLGYAGDDSKSIARREKKRHTAHIIRWVPWPWMLPSSSNLSKLLVPTNHLNWRVTYAAYEFLRIHDMHIHILHTDGASLFYIFHAKTKDQLEFLIHFRPSLVHFEPRFTREHERDWVGKRPRMHQNSNWLTFPYCSTVHVQSPRQMIAKTYWTCTA